MEILSRVRSFGGWQLVCRHDSAVAGTPMRFGVYLPPQADDANVPVLWFLSGLTCTEANFTEKAGAQRVAADLGLMLVVPDTSPRGEGVANDEAYDLGQGAGFYLDATQAPWAPHFMMESWITVELPQVIAAEFPADMARQGITGHSMGGHGALTLALRHPETYRAVSAFAPIVAPSQVPWGQKAFNGYLGADQKRWRQHDTVALIEDGKRVKDILVDVGTGDPFFEKELKPELLEAACKAAGIPLTLRRQEGYDHSYLFISTFMEDHIRWHAERL